MKKNSTRRKEFNITKLIPSMATLAGLCVGISSIKFALDGKWEVAVIFIVIASLIDAVDGKIARALNATSSFGGHLDSLSDFINFGFVPALILYLWSMHDASKFGWAAVLFFTMCCALRLARFNSDQEQEDSKTEWKQMFFKGVPSPAGALGCLAPMMVEFATNGKFIIFKEKFEFVNNPNFLIYYTAFIGILMASRIPTYSMKKMSINKDYSWLIMLIMGGFFISLITAPWITVLFTGFVYYGLIPFGAIHYFKLANDKSESK